MEINPMRFDLLKELNNIGSGGALTSLSQMASDRLQIHVPTIKLVEYHNMSESIDFDSEDKLVGVLVNVNGDLNVTLMFMLTVDGANAFISTLLNTPKKETDTFNELELSVLKEAANIMFSAYVNTLTMMLNKNVKVSIPYFAIDMAQAILGVAASLYGEISEKGVFVEAVFEIDKEDFIAYLVMVPEKESYDMIAQAMGVDL